MSQNAFENGSQKMIPAVLVYVLCGSKVLMLHRAQREGDIHSGKWNGLGGKLEKGESFLMAAQRELQEESGLKLPLTAFKSMGQIHFPNFKAAKNEDWMVGLFVAEAPDSVLNFSFSQSAEGQCEWVEKTEIANLNLWPGDKLFLPSLLEGKKQNGCIWYEQGQVVKTWLELL